MNTVTIDKIQYEFDTETDLMSVEPIKNFITKSFGFEKFLLHTNVYKVKDEDITKHELFIKTKFKPRPVYLGDVESIDGLTIDSYTPDYFGSRHVLAG